MAQVLVVEDDFATSLLVAALLRRNGINCTSAADGVSASQLLAANRYDAIVLDLVLPRKDGFELLLEISRTAPELLPRIVVHTALPPSSLSACRELRGVSAVVLKPADIRELTGAILRIIGVRPRDARPYAAHP